MASQAFFTLKSCFSFVDDRVFTEFLWTTVFSLCQIFLNLFWFMGKVIKRGIGDQKPQENGSSFSISPPQEHEEDGGDLLVSGNSIEFSSDAEETEDLPLCRSSSDEEDGLTMHLHDTESTARASDDDAEEEEGFGFSSNFTFSFFGQDFKDLQKMSAGTGDSVLPKPDSSPNVLKYQVMSGSHVSGFMEEPETMSFTVQEMFVESNDDGMPKSHLILDDYVSESEDHQELQSHSNGDSPENEAIQELPQSMSSSDGFSWPFDADSLTSDLHKADFAVQKSRSSDVDSLTSDLHEYDFTAQKRDVTIREDSPSDCDHVEEEEASPSSPNEILTNEEIDDDISYEVELFEIPCPMIIPEDQAVDDDFIELMPQPSDETEVLEESWSENCENLSEKDTKFEEESFAKGSWDSDDSEEDEDEDEDDEFDILMEHQELVKQMKMERKNSILKGLPTISEEEEECETPRILEDLKPLKIDADKFEYKDIILEIHKFYRSYAEKMKKLDILNYQTLQAISFLQLKDSQLYMPSKKTLISSISFTLFKQQRVYADPSLKSINEMHRDLELVYVGQACLTWEILLWQHGKVKVLQEHEDSRNLHSYNQVGVEFQQFQVLLQRFLEDERFQGPRIQHFVKNRCLFRGLLQVPCIKDDCPKNKKESAGEEGSYSISIAMLADAIKDSMQTFWEFIHADKDESNGSLTHNLNQSPADSQLLENVKACLEKKERKIKDIQRSRNCIVKKFQKQKNSVPTCSALLISQVELKLVARVLTMPRLTTDQLTWCLNKLNNISIVNRRVGIEPSFLLFPC